MGVTAAVSLASTSNADTYTTGSFTPVAGDLLVVFAGVTATVSNPTCTASANGITFTRVVNEAWSAGAHRQAIFVADQLVPASPAAMTVTVDVTGDTGSGANISVARVDGMTLTGAAAVRQASANTNAVGTGGAYTLTFGAATLSTNPVLAALSNNSSPAGMTPPTGFTELHDIGYSTPTAGLETCYDASGGYSSFTWGSTSATIGTANAIELDTSTSTNYPVTGTVAGTSAAAGTITATLTLAGAQAAVSAAAGTITADHPLAGVAAAASTTAGAPGVNYPVTGAVAAVSSTSGAAALDQAVTGTSAAASAASGAVVVDHPIAGTVAGTSGTAGAAGVSQGLTGTVAGVTDTTGSVTLTHPLAGAAAAVSAVSGTATADHPLAGTLPATAGAAGALTANLSILGTTQATSDLAGAVTATYALTGTVDATADVTGAPTASYQLAGTVDVVATIGGFLNYWRDITYVSLEEINQRQVVFEPIPQHQAQFDEITQRTATFEEL